MPTMTVTQRTGYLSVACVLFVLVRGAVIVARADDTFSHGSVVPSLLSREAWPPGLQALVSDIEEAVARQDRRLIEPRLAEVFAAGGPLCRSGDVKPLSEWGPGEWRGVSKSLSRGIAVVEGKRAIAPFTLLSLPSKMSTCASSPARYVSGISGSRCCRFHSATASLTTVTPTA
jgi:hypothetical protein